MAIPVTLPDARRQLKMEHDDASRDDELRQYIADAADWVERYTGLFLTARDVTETFTGSGPVRLRAWPIDADAVPGVAYRDVDGTPVAAVGARLDNSTRPARVLPPAGHFWPFLDARQPFSVTIRAGYEDGQAVPGNLRRAMLVLISAYDVDREGGETWQNAEAAARSLCSSYRMWSV